MKGKSNRGEERKLDIFLCFAFLQEPSAHYMLSVERYSIIDVFLGMDKLTTFSHLSYLN